MESLTGPWNLGQSHLVGVGILAALAWAWFGAVRREIAFAVLGLAVLLGAVFGRLVFLILAPEAPQPLWDPFTPGYASFGVLLGGALAAAPLWSEPRQVRLQTLDVVVPAGLVALASARFGCLLEGCDFGRAASVPWAIRYAPGEPAWQAHLSRGWIDPGSAASALVHPFPLYMALGTLFVVLVTVLAAKRLRLCAGSTAAAAAIGYLGVRAGFEAFRDPATAPFLGIMNLHLAFVVAGIGGVALWWWWDVTARGESP